MATASTVTNLLFIGLVAAVAMLFVLATLKAFQGSGSGIAWIVFLAVVLDVMLVVPGVLAYLGFLDRYDTRPPLALVPVLVATLCTVIVAASSIGERFARLPLSGLVGYQLFRLPVEWLLHRLFLEGAVPVQMTVHGRNFDIISGITGGLLGLWLLGKRESPLLVTLWNCMGLALLANIVAVAVLSTPAPFRTFLEEPANRLPGVFPFIWLPTFLVQAALFGHLIVFRALRRRSG
jgi:hypothetical protein